MNLSKKIHPQGKSLLRLLKATPEGFPLHLAEGQRHPSSTYAISLSQVLRRIEEVLERLSTYTFSVQMDVEQEDDRELALATEALVTQLDRHLLDCAAIALVYGGAGSPLLREFEAAVRAFAEPRQVQAQILKEQLGRVRPLSFRSPSVIVSGFFIEGADAAGSLGPSPAVHGGRNTAFSYNLYLRRAFLELNLANAKLYELLKRQAGLKEVAAGPTENPELVKIATKLAALAPYVFPDEARANMPHVFVKTEAGVDVAVITVPSLKKPQTPPSPSTLCISHSEAELGADYRIPYAAQD